ncbi:hypothetical protein NP233_g1761 [Leucocoprinus birnbaumii]|uniref:DUF6534 domain-containing protein n=1 Tax=Leucocoprinus birnbaumii TaxID=56174 RepID=A0AAD5YVI1_9AGAR|nr:hypothetical protein NP233_g1761 [Leucocoprinus birnbaumii]
MLDSLHMAMVVHGIYFYLIENFGQAAAMLKPTWSILTHVYFTIASDLCIRSVFGKRVWTLSHSYLLTGGIAATTLACAISGTIFISKAWHLGGFMDFHIISVYLYVSLGSGVAADILVAVSLCVALSKTRSGFKKADNLIHTLMAYAINTSLLTTLCSAGCFITYAVWPDRLIFLGIYFCLNKLYFNSLMAALNARQTLREKISGLSTAPTSLTARGFTGSALRGIFKKDSVDLYELETGVRSTTPVPQIQIGIERHITVDGHKAVDGGIAPEPEQEKNLVIAVATLPEDRVIAQVDARRKILSDGFAEIKKKAYPGRIIPKDWPREEDVGLIADRTSSDPNSAAFILRFIGDSVYNDPPGQLRACVEILQTNSQLLGSNSLNVLDPLYTHIISEIPEDIRFTTFHILGLWLLCDTREAATPVIVANYLGIDRELFILATDRLGPVLKGVPLSIELHNDSDKSFLDYLRKLFQSPTPSLGQEQVHLDVALKGLEWLGYCRKKPTRGGLIARDDIRSLIDHSQIPDLPQIVWSTGGDEALRNTLLRSCAFKICWKACRQISQSDQVEKTLNVLSDFDFNLDYLKWWQNDTREFAYFIRWLISLKDNNSDLITADPGWRNRSDSRIISIQHRDDNPESFVEPFRTAKLKCSQILDQCYSISFLLGKGGNSNRFCLYVDSSMTPKFFDA